MIHLHKYNKWEDGFGESSRTSSDILFWQHRYCLRCGKRQIKRR